MRYLTKLKFRHKIILGISGIVVFIAMVIAPITTEIATRALVEENKKRGSALVRNMAARAVDPMLALDLLRLKNMVDEQRSVNTDVVYAFVLDDTNQVLVSTFQGGFPVDLIRANAVADEPTTNIQLVQAGREYIYDYAAPILIEGQRFGTVRLGLTRKYIQEKAGRLMMAVAGLSGGTLVVAILLSAFFASRVTWRLNRLREYAEEMVRGNLDSQTGPTLRRNCWEIMDCSLKQCPAHGDERRRCWYLAGTLCPDCERTSFPAKLRACKHCAVYRENVGDEIQDLAETFDVMALTIKDHIDELKEAERVLTQQQELLRTVLDVNPDLVSLVDADLRYQAVNKSFAEYVGRPPEDILGKTDFDLRPHDEAEHRNRENMEVLETGRRVRTESKRMRPEGVRFYHTEKVPVRDRDGNIVGVLRTARDVTEIKIYQEQLIQAQKMESIGKLAGGVAHEINTPLGVILGYAQLLQEDVVQGSQIFEDLVTIEKQVKVCRKIVSDLLGFSRQTETAKRPMCLNNSIMEAISLVQHTFGLDHVVIERDLDETMPVIYGDPEKLKQVWINLLNNARDAMNGDSGVITVRSRLLLDEDKVSVVISDTGEGVAPENLEKIFEPFYSTKPVGAGTGLGLSVSFGIVENHGGTIRAESPVPDEYRPTARPAKNEPGAGTAFIVDIPLEHEDNAG